MFSRIKIISVALLIVISTPLALTLCQSWLWIGDLISHFSLYIILITPLTLLPLLLMRQWLFFIIGFVIYLVFLTNLFDYRRDSQRQIDASSSLRLLTYNIFVHNTDHQASIDEIVRHNADILVLLEVNDQWQQSLQSLESSYPHSFFAPQSDPYGLAIMSRYPLHNTTLHQPAVGTPFVSTEVVWQETEIQIFAVHLMPPLTPSWWRNGLETLRAILSVPKLEHYIISGDFNCTPNGLALKRLRRETDLRLSGHQRTFDHTWSKTGRGIALQIDHSLISSNLAESMSVIGNRCTSDHRPIIDDITVLDSRRP